MKTKKIIGLLLASVIVLSGCSNSGSVQKDGKYVVASLKDKNLFADDLYSQFLSSPTGKNATFNFVLQKIIDTYFPVDKDMEQYADDAVENIEAQYQSQYGDEADAQIKSALAQSGYSDLESYRKSLIQSLQYATLVRNYVKNDFDKVFEDYYKTANPRYITLIKVSVADMSKPTAEEKEKLKEVNALLKTDKDFADIASSYSEDSSKDAKGNLGLVDSKTTNLASTYGEEVEKKAFALKKGQTSGQIKGSDGYYFLKCTETSKEKIKEELKSVDLNSPLLGYNDYIIYDAFETYKLTYDDKNIQKIIEDFIKDARKTKKESGGNS